jgi:hypothetical protein
VFEQVQQHRHRDVVRQIGDEPRWSPGQLRDPEGVLVDHGERGAGLHETHGVRQLFREATVDLDGDHIGACLEQPQRQ